MLACVPRLSAHLLPPPPPLRPCRLGGHARGCSHHRGSLHGAGHLRAQPQPGPAALHDSHLPHLHRLERGAGAAQGTEFESDLQAVQAFDWCLQLKEARLCLCHRLSPLLPPVSMPPWLHLSIAARRGADEMHPLSLPPMRQANNDTATLSWIQANLPNWNATSDSWKVRKGARHCRGIETDRFQLHHLCLAWPRDSPAGQPFGSQPHTAMFRATQPLAAVGNRSSSPSPLLCPAAAAQPEPGHPGAADGPAERQRAHLQRQPRRQRVHRLNSGAIALGPPRRSGGCPGSNVLFPCSQTPALICPTLNHQPLSHIKLKAPPLL